MTLHKARLIGEGRPLLYATAGLVVLLSVVPMLRLLVEAVWPSGGLSLQPLREVLSDSATWRATRHSLEVGIAGTLLATVIGSAAALLFTLSDIRAKGPLVFAFVLPLMIPPQIAALSWLQVFGPSSVLLKILGLAPPLGSPNPLYSRAGIVLLLGTHFAPLVFLSLRAGLRALPRDLVEAARASGARAPATVVRIVLPVMMPPLVAGVALTFVSCIGNFGIPALLGIPANYQVLTTLIFQRLATFGPDVLSQVAILSVLIGVIAGSGIAVQGWMLTRKDYRLSGGGGDGLPFALGRWRGWIEAAAWGYGLAVLVIPLLAMLCTALVVGYGVPLTVETATLDNFRFILFDHDASARAFRNSMSLSAAAALILVPLCVVLAYFLVLKRDPLARALNVAAEMPYALPGVVLAVAAILIFIQPLPLTGGTIYNTVWIILFAYVARFLTLELRPIIAGCHQLDPALEEAARMCGAGILRRLWSIVLPLLAPAATAGALLVFMQALNELTVSALLWSSGAETLGVVVYNLESGGFTTKATAVAVLAVAATVAVMLALTLLAGRLPRGTLPWQK
ncbi:ABC transporter permease [Rhodovibrio salinarum]|uniref:Iron ABC transporter permease n=1 Tax=Rhodovibrio salinarum TaxID=1087 RepID=A0A934V058_9PROT|nr:iron ABC transporter permease [Rhodovibrio salinarum]MBK1697256.1 iron ABC transporter permease [Rhodovibrio salinarum]